ncbi:hypothetical protein [Piscinibacter koreensis]|uniref:Uncharacterized protein n=1 Tax=Piscinibacter koreensis TaxID=2742824 RepID=A0A7Y6NQT5_9BURK|nr:hypothetical protein [Schlegelella koreensis]NUZ07643.1 hypothetical protein [Schlegelella koreensis]
MRIGHRKVTLGELLIAMLAVNPIGFLALSQCVQRMSVATGLLLGFVLWIVAALGAIWAIRQNRVPQRY